MQKSNLIKHTAIMTAVNLIMRSISVSFNAYLTGKIGISGVGLFQLVMTFYSLAVTFSCAGIRLATTRVAVEINTLKKNDMNKSLSICITYAGICGCIIGIFLFIFSDFISIYWLSNEQTALPLRILSLSLPFVAMSSALGGYFTAIEKIPQFSLIQLLEQLFKITIVVWLISNSGYHSSAYACMSVVTGMTASEIFSFCMSSLLKKITSQPKTDKSPLDIFRMLRVALPDAAGTCIRSILLTVEHTLIPKGFEKSGRSSKTALAAYGNIHAVAMPLLLLPSAVLSSLSSLLVPDLAKRNEIGDSEGINAAVSRNLKRTALFSILCAVIMAAFAPYISNFLYKTNEAVKYIRILSPLVPVMYLDIITDGMLKGLDQQVYSMRYNIIDSALCVGMVYFLLPKHAIKGYIFILYASEIINFYLSIGRLIKICDIRLFRAHAKDNSRPFHTKKYSDIPSVYGYRTYWDRAKRNPNRLFFRRKDRIQDLHGLQ
ncbi:MAG: hypothetical protein E7547_01595 [Ruminococcaceae bacterium]|nr:hypothetical protein [Oscillospiraceae bacterium]